MNIQDTMLALCETFPSLAAKMRISDRSERLMYRGWDPDELDAYAVGPASTSGLRHAARFVLAVWNSRGEWKCGTFNAVEALQCWDRDHRDAFQRWVLDPWWA